VRGLGVADDDLTWNILDKEDMMLILLMTNSAASEKYHMKDLFLFGVTAIV
jgi:hypothetical protein